MGGEGISQIHDTEDSGNNERGETNTSELHSRKPSTWETLSPELKESAEQVTEGKNWDYNQFRRSMCTLAVLEVPVPAHNRPESIDLGNMYNFIIDLDRRTRESGREHGILMLADWGNGKLLAHKKHPCRNG